VTTSVEEKTASEATTSSGRISAPMHRAYQPPTARNVASARVRSMPGDRRAVQTCTAGDRIATALRAAYGGGEMEGEAVRRPRAGVLAAVGLALGVAGVVSYFLVVFRFGAWLPGVRNHAVPNWLVLALGLAVSTLALVRARRRLLPAALLALNVGVAIWFAAMLYVFSAMPARSGPAIGGPRPCSRSRIRAGGPSGWRTSAGAAAARLHRGHWCPSASRSCRVCS
jgi:hypothetical protein